MILKSRTRLVGVIMSFLIIVLFATLGIIYLTTKIQTTKENKEMLTLFAEYFDKNGFPSEDSLAQLSISNDLGSKTLEEMSSFRRFQVATFYAVAFDLDKNATDVLNDLPSGFSNDYLKEYALSLIESGKTYGEGKDVTYLITYGDDYILVTMMDTVLTDTTIAYLTKNMIVFGAIAILVLFILSIILSKWIMSPIERAYEKQKQFISDAGHELKTPISTIGANIELLKREIPESKWLENITYENKRMSTIVTQLLDLARLENIKSSVEQVNLSDIVTASVMAFEATAFEKGVRLEYNIDSNILVEGNSSNLEKLVSVLTDNAINHCLNDGEVTINLSQDSGKAKLTVSNTGQEIPPEERSKIFERFYKSDTSRRENIGHYGLGLSIAKAIVEDHKGKIWVDCQDNKVIFTTII